ncbi:hypothetical protein K435DRAFT_812626 [Dendrothele bispora CBS 962.96]|uniref:Amidohydrolase-related domain-containing protein n=1 Tax=Dendrothele bispora (strain CBS 962.96) TaxID=1314807 RepID=A0A4S8KNL6_DENBC|nr:hypothetical protein K435DRAFT_812626 [Dendrothele bispora CBS 962.96]
MSTISHRRTFIGQSTANVKTGYFLWTCKVLIHRVILSAQERTGPLIHGNYYVLPSSAIIHSDQAVDSSVSCRGPIDSGRFYGHRRGCDHFLHGTPPVLIRDAKILTGDLDSYSSNGTDPDTLHGSILLDKGLIIRVGTIPPELLEDVKRRNKEYHGLDLVEVDAGGKWITPGLVDLHSHIGVQALPILKGASDGNSQYQPINPFLRSVDGMRQTEEKSVRQMVLEPPRGLFGFRNDTWSEEEEDYVPWRHMKHACGHMTTASTQLDGYPLSSCLDFHIYQNSKAKPLNRILCKGAVDSDHFWSRK